MSDPYTGAQFLLHGFMLLGAFGLALFAAEFFRKTPASSKSKA